jgi:hypothetical protein
MTELMGAINIIQIYFDLKIIFIFLLAAFTYKIKVVYLQRNNKFIKKGNHTSKYEYIVSAMKSYPLAYDIFTKITEMCLKDL